YADDQRRDGDQETGDRTRDPDVEEHAFLRNRLADADEGAERARQRDRHRQEKRQRRIDVIIATGQIVPELVAAEDSENRRAVRKATDERSGRDGGEEQQGVQPDPIPELGPRLPDDVSGVQASRYSGGLCPA